MAWRFTNISNRSRSRGVPILPTPPTVATAATIGSVRTYEQLSNLPDKDKGTSRTEPGDFGVTVDNYKDPTNDALDPEALMRTLYNLQNTDNEHDHDRDVRTLNALTLYTAVEAVQLADYNDAPIAALEDEHIIDDDDDDDNDFEEEEEEKDKGGEGGGKDRDDTTMTGTSEPVVTAAVTILHVFTVGASSSGSLSMQAPLVPRAFGHNTSVLLDETMHYAYRNDIPSSELKLGL